MEEETQIQILISSIIALIINLSFSITQILKEALTDIPSVAGYEWLHPFLIMCFFIAEIAGIYGLLFKILNFGNN
ncbi:MAG: hypothetical protein PF542_01870 [Nanoarchaeota archaeon]|jgi:hypothetical protein|nr:hypothetical protein [Nanoarchaeota archaeon]